MIDFGPNSSKKVIYTLFLPLQRRMAFAKYDWYLRWHRGFFFFGKSSMCIVLNKICYCLLLILPLLVALHLNKHSFFPSRARFPAIFWHLYLSNFPKMCTINKSCTVHFQSPTHVKIKLIADSSFLTCNWKFDEF